ncbi:PREDICTED: serine/threonine-protein kinase sid1-like [Acropora digitifera]|uniref:serine/threonine-protein kinase sid1-like n=1 Tax=Acropora digitifera TaxID=70779 RepID=UPI00077A1F9B|nr:PREDICTED: serine/threonine-protein kinase sid1-like [Acropora digitifera]
MCIPETFGLLDGQFQDGRNYVLNEKLGSGSYGVCHRATTISGSLTFCIKKCYHVKEEILALTLAKKDNVKYIVDYYGTKLEGGTAYVCMQFMKRGTLEKHIERQREKLPVGAWPIIDEGTCFNFVGDILKGVEFLNSKGLVHGDIKGDNVLLDESFTHVKLADFGLSRKIEENVLTPDVLRTGRLLIEMLNGERSSILGRFFRKC